MNRFVERTPHSRLEQKQTALAWHYRETDEWLGTLRAQQLMTALIPLCMRLNLQIMPGSKVVEVKSPEFSKGSEVRRLLRRERYDFILAMGDDTTDDDMFRALPRAAVTVKVGAASEYARYNLWRQSDVLPFLERLGRKRQHRSFGSRNGHTRSPHGLGTFQEFVDQQEGRR